MKAATIASALYRDRLNRRSTARCTRRRSGLNSAATTSVAGATATGVWNREHLGGEQHQPDEQSGGQRRDDGVSDHPADDAVDRVQPVLEHGHADAGGKTAKPSGVIRSLTTKPMPHELPDASDPAAQRRDEDDGAAVQPLELLAALPGRPPVPGHLKISQASQLASDAETSAPCSDVPDPRWSG